MTTSFLLAERDSAFHMRRPTLSNGGFVTDVDADVDKRLQELDELLGKHVLQRPKNGHDEGPAKRAATKGARRAVNDSGSDGDRAATSGEPKLVELLTRPLTPWRPVDDDDDQGTWAEDSLADYLAKAKDKPANLTLADYIEQISELSALRYEMKARLDKGRFALNANARAVLQGRSNIQDYLIARAYHVGGRREATAMYNYLIGHRDGVRSVADYAAISAARAILARKRLKVPGYRNDNGGFAKTLKDEQIPLSSAGFNKALNTISNGLMFNEEANKLIESATIGEIPDSLKPKLIRYIQSSKIPITADNVNLFLPTFVAHAYEIDTDEPASESADVDDTTYAVQFRDRLDATVDVDRDAVRYAAQLFHGMVLGEELGVFDAFQFLLHSRMLVGGGMQVRDKGLREDLRLYTLSNEYRDLGRPGHPTQERTRAAERKMFARQVFAQGDGELIEGMSENTEFRQLWQVLMLESARYLERAQEAYNPDSFVSKQNVMQAIEDLQYNLSTYCVGWPQVMAPAIDAELNYVLTRFIGNEKIAQQVLPAGGSWKRVIDKLNTERPKKRPIPAAALLYAKAWQGLEILNSIAEYSPAVYENDGEFSKFISLIDAYITTESKLQRHSRPHRGEEPPPEEDEDGSVARELPPRGEREPAPESANDEWDF